MVWAWAMQTNKCTNKESDMMIVNEAMITRGRPK